MGFGIFSISKWPVRLAMLALSLPAGANAVSVCSEATCGACTPPTANFGISTLISGADLPDNGDTVTGFVDPNDGTPRRFVVSQEGIIWVWNGSQILATPFLDITALVENPGDFGESGLLSMAVSPDYTSNGQFYVYYTGEAGAPGADGDIVIQRYVRSANPDVANTTPTTIVSITHPNGNHNGGTLAFGPDGFLYVSTGDGGGSCDNSSGGPNSQNINEILGKILRLDVANVDPGATPPECESNQGYEVPTGNPFQGATPGCGEIWAVGLRNPFRMSFDRETGDIFFGDVGQNTWEEINFLRAGMSPPLNYAWKCREGCQTSTCSNTGGDLCPDTLTPGATTCAWGSDIDTTANSFFVYDPIFCHSNSPWASIMGGYMYRGDYVPDLADRYFYSDYFCGQLWVSSSFDRMNPAAAASTCWEDTGGGITGFAQDHIGEVYIVRGGDQQIDCIHDGNPRGCFWSADGLFSDGFETGNPNRWSDTVP